MQHPAAAERISECSLCPSWVERCVHFDGQAVRLINWWRSGRTFKDGWAHWHVCALEDVCDSTSIDWARNVAITNRRAVALASFDEAAERLMRGGD